MEDLPLGKIAALVPEFVEKDLPLGRTLMMLMMMMMMMMMMMYIKIQFSSPSVNELMFLDDCDDWGDCGLNFLTFV